MAGTEGLRRGPGDGHEEQAPNHRPPDIADRQLAHHRLHAGHQPDNGDADTGAQDAQNSIEQIAADFDGLPDGRSDDERFDIHQLRRQNRHQRGRCHRRQRRHGITTQNQFESVEGAGQRGTKGRADG